MNLNQLTLEQLKSLLQCLEPAPSTPPSSKPLIGEYVIVRAKDAGVHAGYLVDYEGRSVTLRDSRRLWYWKVAENQHSLSGVAEHGLTRESKIPTVIKTLVIGDACEIIETTEKCRKSIQDAPVYTVK